MYYIVALGNPGEKYRDTRHNVGWFMLDFVVEQFGLPSPISRSVYSGLVSEGVILGEEVTVLYPETFMNNSGVAVKKLVPKADLKRLLVIYDDIDLPLGEVRVSVGRGDGGHNGIKSIIGSLGSKDFARIRVGIAPVSFWTGKMKRPSSNYLPKYVLGKFTRSENEKLESVKEKVRDIVKTILENGDEGVTKAMNKFN